MLPLDGEVPFYTLSILPVQTHDAEGNLNATYTLKCTRRANTSAITAKNARTAIYHLADLLSDGRSQWEKEVRDADQASVQQRLQNWRAWVQNEAGTRGCQEKTVPFGSCSDWPDFRVRYSFYSKFRAFRRLKSSSKKNTVVRRISALYPTNSPISIVSVARCALGASGQYVNGVTSELFISASDRETYKSALTHALADCNRSSAVTIRYNGSDQANGWIGAVSYLALEEIKRHPDAMTVFFRPLEEGRMTNAAVDLLKSATKSTVQDLKATYPQLSRLSAEVWIEGKEAEATKFWMMTITVGRVSREMPSSPGVDTDSPPSATRPG